MNLIEIIIYIILGVATTVVNYIIYYPLLNVCRLPASVSNAFAWIVAVIFAFITNKSLVFESKAWNGAVALPEFAKFLSCRLGSGILETVFLAVTVDALCWNGNWMKLFISVVVIVVNYIASKFIVFNTQKRPPQE